MLATQTMTSASFIAATRQAIRNGSNDSRKPGANALGVISAALNKATHIHSVLDQAAKSGNVWLPQPQ
ncbi:hypothetical protein D3C76_1868180 [compost metagenome]